jgi:hypothetical protein
MSGHPNNSPRGLWAKTAGMVGADGLKFTPYSTATALLDSDSTGLAVAGGVKVGTTIRIGSTAVTISKNSTGYKIGSRYISTNTTGNATT